MNENKYIFEEEKNKTIKEKINNLKNEKKFAR